jgi:hypothetical protein
MSATLTVMRMRRVLGFSGAITVAGVLILCFWSAGPTLSPPDLSVVDTQPSGLFDEDGTELLLVSFNVTNNNPEERCVIFVKGAGRATQARRGNLWQEVKGTPINFGPRPLVELWPGRQWEGQLLAPIGTDLCRVWLKYTGGVKQRTIKGTLSSAVLLLPLSVRSRISYKFWRWAGFPDGIVPSSRWREIGLELPLNQLANFLFACTCLAESAWYLLNVSARW